MVTNKGIAARERDLKPNGICVYCDVGGPFFVMFSCEIRYTNRFQILYMYRVLYVNDT